MSYALDTNTIVYFLRGQGHVAERWLALPPAQLCLPTVVAHELLVGVAKAGVGIERRGQVERLLAALTPLPFGLDEARAAVQIRLQLEANGTLIGPFDLLIAATALARGAVLVTRNTREFSRVQGLRLEDWYAG